MKLDLNDSNLAETTKTSKILKVIIEYLVPLIVGGIGLIITLYAAIIMPDGDEDKAYLYELSKLLMLGSGASQIPSGKKNDE